MSTIQTSSLSFSLRALNDRALNDGEIESITGGSIGGCIKISTITPFNPPTSAAPWFDPMWVQVGKTGTLPR